MPIKKFLSFEEARRDLWVIDPDENYYKRVRELFALVERLGSRSRKYGVYKFANISDKNKFFCNSKDEYAS